ncbi:hypothetical protein R3W88_027079 [Solanum pinnatisectum]|uniref:Phosphoribosyltransferase domain-containing protein n=1 Tax=Solanum pinnatisectum TaxID=50273 RepID=A0AAV9LEZ7_9SOLN|nr:hypothetical protein R3W88_027079 [Solanum pinnatisectum]
MTPSSPKSEISQEQFLFVSHFSLIQLMHRLSLLISSLSLGFCSATLLPAIKRFLPEKWNEDLIFYIFLGGTIIAAIDLIKGRGVDNSQIKVVCAVAAPPALTKLSEKYPRLHVYAGIVDPTVNEKGFIISRLGDAGDHSIGT